MKTRCAIAEAASCRGWNWLKAPLSIEDIKSIGWPSCAYACEVELNGIHFRSNRLGPTLEVKNVMVKPEYNSCPFVAGPKESGA